MEITEEEKKLPPEEGGAESTGVTQAPMGEGAEAQSAPEIPAEPEQAPAEPEPQPEPAQRMFTQDEVNALVGKVRQEAREKARAEYASELRDRYGVGGDSEIDDLVGNGQRFDALQGEYESQSATLSDLKSENALLRSGIPEDKFDDVRAILAYKGLEVTPENIAAELATHPEWSGQPDAMGQPQPPQPVKPDGNQAPIPSAQQIPARPAPSVVQKLGGEPQGNPQGEEEAKAEFLRKMFGR